MRKLGLFVGLIFLASMSAGQPALPHVVEGDVEVDDEAHTGTIEARANGEILDSTSVQDGSFGEETDPLLVPETSGEFRLFVDGIDSGETVEYESGAVNDSIDIDMSLEDRDSVTVSTIAEPQEGVVKVTSENIAFGDNPGVNNLKIQVDTSDEVEVNLTVSDSNTEDSGVDEDQLEGTDPKKFIKVDTSVDNEKVNSADAGLSIDKDRIEDPESLVIIHYENGNREGVIDPDYLEDSSDDKDVYLYDFETDSFSTFVAASDTEDPNAETEDGDRTVDEGEEVQFDAGPSSDNTEIESYEWEFSDGETADGETVTHTYDSSDEFTVNLTVTDRAGNTDSTSIEVTVEEPPESSDFGNIGTDDEETETEEETQDEETQEDTSEDQTEETEQETDPEQQDQNQTETETANQTSETEDTQDQEQQSPATGLFTVSQTEGLGLGVIAILALALITLQKTGRVDLSEIPDKVSELRSEEDDSNPDYRFK